MVVEFQLSFFQFGADFRLFSYVLWLYCIVSWSCCISYIQMAINWSIFIWVSNLLQPFSTIWIWKGMSGHLYSIIFSRALVRDKIRIYMPNPWLNVHKSMAAMNYLFSNMTNTVIFMTLGDLRIRHTTAVLFSPLHIWIRILVVYVVKISRGRWPEHPSGKTPDECVLIAYMCIHVNKVI